MTQERKSQKIYALVKNGSIDCMNLSREFILLKLLEVEKRESVRCEIIQIPYLIDPEKSGE